MKAAIVAQQGKLELWDIPIPKVGPYDVLCKLSWGATCAGTDIHLMDGLHPTRTIPFPTILGHESVGRVVEAGKKVKNFRVGDLISRVGCPANEALGLYSSWGGFAEYGIARDHWQMRRDGLPAEQWNSSRVNQVIHPEISEKEAPMVITWRETLSYDKRIGIGPGMRVLLIGSGANALAHCAHACNLGARVTVVGSLRNRSIFLRLPIAGYYDYKDPELAETLKEAEKGKPFDLILDGVGASSTVDTLLPMLKKDGTLGVYGWNGRKSYALNPFHGAASFRIYADGYDEEESNALVQSLILQGKLDAGMWYDLENPVPLEKIGEAYASLRHHDALKYLIRLG